MPSLLCITVHELCHGLTAYALGDDTAKRAGRLTLNPIKHIDITGLAMMIIFHFGWAKPVPVNMYRFKNPKKGMAITALAGPLSNVVLAAVFMAVFGLLYVPCSKSAAGSYILTMLSTGAYISLGLAVFNLIPVPPLDGSKILFSLLNGRAYSFLMMYERYGSVIMLLLVATGILSSPLSAAVSAVYYKLVPMAQWLSTFVFNTFYR